MAVAVLIVGASFGTAAHATGEEGKQDTVAAQEVIVDFGIAGQAGAANQFLVPDEVSINQGGTVVFRVTAEGRGRAAPARSVSAIGTDGPGAETYDAAATSGCARRPRGNSMPSVLIL
jgi:hypothetical protein